MKLNNDYAVGDGVSWNAGTDTLAGTVVKVTPKTVFVVEDEAELLNGVGSGEADALTFTPGGFVGHTSGTQRWAFKPRSGRKAIKFTLRAKPRIERKLVDTEWVDFERPNYQEVGRGAGSMQAWGRLNHGRDKHYDYNF